MYCFIINYKLNHVKTNTMMTCTPNANTCSDPESFVRGSNVVCLFAVLVDDGREDPNTTICGPSPALQRNASWPPSGVFLCFLTFSCGVADRVWCFVVSILIFAFFTSNNKLFV